VAIDTDAGPSHPSLANSETTDPYLVAAENSSTASASHAAAAAIIGPEPGPEYILAELISGGKAPKSGTVFPFQLVGKDSEKCLI
jgi:hypothetical protein